MRYQFVDCRWELGNPARGRELYRAGHIPGASFLDVDEDLSDLSVPDAGRHPLPDAERFAAAASRAGIGEGVFVVAYGNAGGPERLWWLLRHFGHDDCAVVDVESWHGPLTAGDEPVLVDARIPSRWRGEPNPIDTVPGRIPGAVNAPWNEPLPELPEGEIVAYCGSGVTACVVLHRLYLVGREGRLYPGSWSEWSARGLPVETS